MLGSDPVWYQDVRVLPLRPTEFFPSRDQSADERVNAIVRLVLYAAIAVFAYTRSPGYIAFALVAVSVVSLVHGVGQRRKSAPGTRDMEHGGLAGGGGAGGLAGGGLGGLAGGGPESAQRVARACTRSTTDNPYANRLPGDAPDRPPACKIDDHADAVRANFNAGLVRDPFDVWERGNSQRQFMTMPVTTGAPDTMAFARFCFGGAGRKTCKEDTSMCTGALP